MSSVKCQCTYLRPSESDKISARRIVLVDSSADLYNAVSCVWLRFDVFPARGSILYGRRYHRLASIVRPGSELLTRTCRG